MYKYVRNDLEDEYGILALQDKMLEIMVYIDKLCRKYDIDYCLIGGSAIGAVRHGGFIPWDDDIDIYMTPDNYQKFRKIFCDSLNDENYYLQEWGRTENHDGDTMITMAKVRMNHTSICEETFVSWDIHQGIFVDIFILHHCPAQKFKQIKQYILTEAVVLKGLEIKGYKSKGIKDTIMLLLSRLMPKKWILSKGLKEAFKYQDLDTGYYHGFVDIRGFSRAVFPKDIMFPTRYVPFEQVSLRVPADTDAYCKKVFGEDYMIVPDEKHRSTNKHNISWSVYCDENSADKLYLDEDKLI